MMTHYEYFLDLLDMAPQSVRDSVEVKSAIANAIALAKAWKESHSEWDSTEDDIGNAPSFLALCTEEGLRSLGVI